MENYYNSSNLIKLILKWKIQLLIILIIALVLAAIFSSPSFIKPKYKSIAVVYPANISPYSEESETEQMLQIFQSNDIKDSVIKKFNLAKHYKIDSNYKYFYSTLLYKFNENVKIRKTQYESVEIEVRDIDPDTACAMVKAIMNYYNLKVRRLHNEKYLEVVKTFEKEMSSKRAYMDSLENALYNVSTKYGLIDFGNQAREVTRGFLKTVYGSNSSNINTKEVLILKKNMEQKGGEFIKITQLLINEARTYVDLKVKYDQAKRFYTNEFTYTNVISNPYPADKKCYPIRWLILTMTGIATLLFSIVIIFIIENRKTHTKVD